MSARVLSIAMSLALLFGVIETAGAQEPPPPEVPEVVQIEDPAGDANYLNSQGGLLPLEGDETTPGALSVSDLLRVWWTNDAETIAINFQTVAPPPSSNAAYLYRAFTNPGGDFPDGCVWWEAVVEGPTWGGDSFGRVRDLCADTDPVEGEIAIIELSDGTGLTTVTVPLGSHPALVVDGTIVAPIAEVRNATGAPGAGPVTAPVVDDTKVGTDYTISSDEDSDEPKKKKKKKKKKRKRPGPPILILTGGNVRAL